MESYLEENFGGVKGKNSSEEALRRWRKLCSVVKNPKRRFRFTANLDKRGEAQAIKHANHEKLRVAVLVSKAALQFIHGLKLRSEYVVPEEVKAAGFQICADELGSIVEGHDSKKLIIHSGVTGIAAKLATSPTDGLDTAEDSMQRRQDIYGINKFTESEIRSFWVFVWEALQDTTLIILAICAFVSLVVGITMEGWPKGAHDGLGIVASILLVVFVTATSDYRQSLQFKDLDKEKRKIQVQVTRKGFRQRISIYDLLPGDVVNLAIGDQVPADGLFISGFSLLINESSLTGESEPVVVNEENPFLLSGTKVQDGSCKMLVTTVGMRTQWGKLMATLSEGGASQERNDIVEVATSSLSSLARLPWGSSVAASSAENVTKPTSAPTLQLYEFEACPFCRRVREAMTELDLSPEVYPCPKGSLRHRDVVRKIGGKEQFPLLVDASTGVTMYESGDIVKYLFKQYGQGKSPSFGLLESTIFTGWVPTLLRAGRGMTMWSKAGAVPAEKLELFSFENNTYARIVREALCELELPYILRNVGEGSSKTSSLLSLAGSKQVPYLMDPNTGFRSGDHKTILSYLFQQYSVGVGG